MWKKVFQTPIEYKAGSGKNRPSSVIGRTVRELLVRTCPKELFLGVSNKNELCRRTITHTNRLTPETKDAEKQDEDKDEEEESRPGEGGRVRRRQRRRRWDGGPAGWGRGVLAASDLRCVSAFVADSLGVGLAPPSVRLVHGPCIRPTMVVASLPGGVRLVTWTIRTILAVINWMCFDAPQ